MGKNDEATVTIWIVVTQILCIVYATAMACYFSPLSNSEVSLWITKTMEFLLFYGLGTVNIAIIASWVSQFDKWKRNREYEKKHYSEVMHTILNSSDTEDVKMEAVSLLVPKKYRKINSQ